MINVFAKCNNCKRLKYKCCTWRLRNGYPKASKQILLQSALNFEITLQSGNDF